MWEDGLANIDDAPCGYARGEPAALSSATIGHEMSKSPIFYAWQDDHLGRVNRSFIHDCLSKAIKELNRSSELHDLVVDRDTRNVPGMPDIGQTVLAKIERAALVVADLTVINPESIRRPDERPVPNPNVVFEVGYAMAALGSRNIVGVVNEAFGRIEELPFDLRPKRVMTYSLSDGEDKSATRKQLVADLARAIALCLGESEHDKIRRNSRITDTLIELEVVGSEIDHWQELPALPKVLDGLKESADELCRQFEQAGYVQSAQNVSFNMSRKMSTAAELALNEENWPRVKESVRTAGELARFLRGQMALKLDEAAHDECIDKIRSVPARLNDQSRTLQMQELEKLSVDFRKWSLFPILPDHPGFSAGMGEISLALRKCFLRWLMDEPLKQDVQDSLADISHQLSQLVEKYAPASD